MLDHPLVIAACDRLALPAEARCMVRSRYSEPHRHYHTLRHIELMLGEIPLDALFANEMIAATLYHDVIYDPARADNEEASLALFHSAAASRAWKPPLDEALVSEMILATKGHHFFEGSGPRVDAVNTLLKADLSILWHPDRQVYAWYAAGVRREYAFVPEDRFRQVRARIVEGLCADLLQSGQLDPPAAGTLRRNVAWELQSQP